MFPNKLCVTFFGPADGLQAYSVGASSPDLAYLPVVSNDVQLQRHGKILAVERLLIANQRLTWIGFYKQVNEHGLERGGHTFGVGFWFDSKIVSEINQIYKSLNLLMDGFEAHCVSDGSFVQRDLFKSFVFDNFEKKYEDFYKKFFSNWVNIDYRMGLSVSSSLVGGNATLNENEDTLITECISWALKSAGGNKYKKLLIPFKGYGTFTDGIKIVDYKHQLDGDAYIKLLNKYQNLELELNTLKQRNLNEEKTKETIESEKNKLHSEVESLKNETQRLKGLLAENIKLTSRLSRPALTSEIQTSDKFERRNENENENIITYLKGQRTAIESAVNRVSRDNDIYFYVTFSFILITAILVIVLSFFVYFKIGKIENKFIEENVRLDKVEAIVKQIASDIKNNLDKNNADLPITDELKDPGKSGSINTPRKSLKTYNPKNF